MIYWRGCPSLSGFSPSWGLVKVMQCRFHFWLRFEKESLRVWPDSWALARSPWSMQGAASRREEMEVVVVCVVVVVVVMMVMMVGG